MISVVDPTCAIGVRGVSAALSVSPQRVRSMRQCVVPRTVPSHMVKLNLALAQFAFGSCMDDGAWSRGARIRLPRTGV